MLTDEELHSAAVDALEVLDVLFIHLLFSAKETSQHMELGYSMLRLKETLHEIERRNPELKESIAPVYLSHSEIKVLENLSEDGFRKIDYCLLSFVSDGWRKNAYIIGHALLELSDSIPEMSDVCYAKRLKYLVKKHDIEVQGNLDCIGYCEVRSAV